MSTTYSLPIWAPKISVRETHGALFVTGERRRPDHLVRPAFVTSDVKEAQAPVNNEPDLLLRFASAFQKADLLNFVSQVGPVWGRVVRHKIGRNGTETVVVKQSWRELERLRDQFLVMTHIISKLKRSSELTDDDFERLFLEWSALSSLSRRRNGRIKVRLGQGITMALSERGPVFSSSLSSDRAEATREFTLCLAHWEICRLLNQHAPLVTYFDGREVREVPANRREGILSALYYMLRRVYLGSGSMIAACAKCNTIFKVMRKDQTCCSRRCSHQHRNLKDYYKRGKHRRKELVAAARSNTLPDNP